MANESYKFVDGEGGGSIRAKVNSYFEDHVKQTSITDMTAGSMLIVGAGGWLSESAPPSATLATAITSGLWNISGSDPDNPFGSTGSTLFVKRHAGTYVIQHVTAGSSGQTASRRSTDNGATWGGWDYELTGNDNLSRLSSPSAARSNLELEDAATTTVATIRGGTTKGDVGLGSVRNVSSWSQTEADNRFGRLATANSWGSRQTFQGVQETVDQITGTSPTINPFNGSIQYWTLTANSSPNLSFQNGESITLMVSDGSNYTINWGGQVTWIGDEPVLESSGWTIIVLWRAFGTIFGKA